MNNDQLEDKGRQIRANAPKALVQHTDEDFPKEEGNEDLLYVVIQEKSVDANIH